MKKEDMRKTSMDEAKMSIKTIGEEIYNNNKWKVIKVDDVDEIMTVGRKSGSQWSFIEKRFALMYKPIFFITKRDEVFAAYSPQSSGRIYGLDGNEIPIGSIPKEISDLCFKFESKKPIITNNEKTKEDNMDKKINECDNMEPEVKKQMEKNAKTLLHGKKQDMVISEKIIEEKKKKKEEEEETSSEESSSNEKSSDKKKKKKKKIDEEMNANALDTKPEFDYMDSKKSDVKTMEDPNASIKSQKDKSNNENDARVPKDAIMRLMKSPANVKKFLKEAKGNKEAMNIVRSMVEMLENEPVEMKKYLGESTFYLLKTTVASQTHMTSKLVKENLDLGEMDYWNKERTSKKNK